MSFRLGYRAGVTLFGLFVIGVSLPYTATSLARHGALRALRRHEAVAAEAGRAVSRAECEAQFSRVREIVRDRFYDPKLNGVDWDRIGADYHSRLAHVQTRLELTDLINQMLGELHASHTLYATEDDIEFHMLPAVMRSDMRGHQVEQIGVLGRRIAGEFVVSASLDGSPAHAAGIESGDHLLTADGQPFTSAGSFRGRAGETVHVVLQRPGEAAVRTVSVTPVKQNLLVALLHATEHSVQVWNVGSRKIGYVHLWAMASDPFRTLLEDVVLRRLHATDGLILDLRDGYGGRPWGYDDVFFQPDIVWEQQMRGDEPERRHTGYARPLVVLINEGTRSSKEFFAYQLKVSRRATLVGTRTAGAFLGADVFPVGTTGLVELPIENLRLDGRPLEGYGVTPNIASAPSGPYTPHDGQLARATQVLLEVIKDTDH